MHIFGALLLIVVMYLVVPIALCAAALVALGGAERLLPGGLRDRALAQRAQEDGRH
ncbi:MAG: hypothetical protein U0531_07550 [Dehalococcoidia bacterium]